MTTLPALAQTAVSTDEPSRGNISPVDYRRPESWLCRPGVDDGTCSAGLDAIAVDAAGRRTPQAYVAADAPAIDCFYIYPTASNDPTVFSDLTPGAQDEKRITRAQAARLGARCRLFVPLYHQQTMTALLWRLRHPEVTAPLDFDPPYQDVRAAWRDYLAHDNKGRGVVVIGHSQGAILAKRLIAEEIDGKPAQKQLVAAYLAGNPDLSTTSFRSIPPCSRTAQTGCIVAWSSYLDGATTPHYFGSAPSGGEALCVNPAAPGGGRGLVNGYMNKPATAPAGDPPYVATVGQLSAECVRDGNGAVLAFRVEPGAGGDAISAGLKKIMMVPGWGLHSLDIALVQGTMLDLLATQTAAWTRRR